jgi:hypothetical protein
VAHCASNSTDAFWLPETVAGTASDDAPKRVIELPPPPVMVGDAVDIQPCGTSEGNRWLGWFSARTAASFLSSFLFHLALVLALGLWLPVPETGSGPISLLVTPYDAETLIFGETTQEPSPAVAPDRLMSDAVVVEHRMDSLHVPAPATESAAPAHRQSVVDSSMFDRTADDFLRTDADVSGALAGRGREARAAMVRIGGGTGESEDAAERGLRWIMSQQREDGSFSFRHLRNACRDPGTEGSTTAATAICMLPFLGAGYTHQEGPYQDVVRRGMYYLMRSARQTPHGADLQNGTMYAQGLSAIALCEAYAMTRDPALRGLADQSLRFIVFAQDAKGGGWRYTPGEPGDTTVTGWQLMALKSGQMAGLSIPSPTLIGIRRFLDHVQSEYGAKYGYMDPRPRDTTTAIGLLCRMYTGWPRDYDPVRRGVEYLDSLGPSKDNMYFNYYATQVMHHFGGEPWLRWNPVMRDYLVATQSKQGNEAGSWHFSGGHGDVGGRLYNTAMAVMTLEVYYRHMPLYTEHALTDAF